MPRTTWLSWCLLALVHICSPPFVAASPDSVDTLQINGNDDFLTSSYIGNTKTYNPLGEVQLNTTEPGFGLKISLPSYLDFSPWKRTFIEITIDATLEQSCWVSFFVPSPPCPLFLWPFQNGIFLPFIFGQWLLWWVGWGRQGVVLWAVLCVHHFRMCYVQYMTPSPFPSHPASTLLFGCYNDLEGYFIFGEYSSSFSVYPILQDAPGDELSPPGDISQGVTAFAAGNNTIWAPKTSGGSRWVSHVYTSSHTCARALSSSNCHVRKAWELGANSKWDYFDQLTYSNQKTYSSPHSQLKHQGLSPGRKLGR